MQSFQYRIKGLLLGLAFGTFITGILLFQSNQNATNLGGALAAALVAPIYAIVIYLVTISGFITAGFRLDARVKQGYVQPGGWIFSTTFVGIITGLAVGVIISFFAEGEYFHYYVTFRLAQSPIPGYFAYIKYIIPVLATLIGFCIVRIIEIKTSKRFFYVFPVSILVIALIFLYQVRPNMAKQLQQQSKEVANTFEIKNFHDQKIEEDGNTYQEITADVYVPKEGEYVIGGYTPGFGSGRLKIDNKYVDAINAVSNPSSNAYNLPGGTHKLSLVYDFKAFCNQFKGIPYDEAKINSLVPETTKFNLTISYTTELNLKEYTYQLKNFKLSNFYQQCQ